MAYVRYMIKVPGEVENKGIKSKKTKRQVGVTLLVLSLVLFVFTTFSIISAVKAFMLGTFGIMIYPVLFFISMVGIALIMNKKFVYSPRYIVYTCLSFFFLMWAIHIIFTWKAGETLSYGAFLLTCYKNITPGGLLTGVFTYALTGLLGSMAGLVTYLIAFIISSYLVINYLEGVKQKEKRESGRPSYETFDFVSPKETLISKDSNPPIAQKEKKSSIDEDIFIDDEEDKLDKASKAREKLGLTHKSEEEKKDIGKETASEKLFKNDNAIWQNGAFQHEKPHKYVYGDMGSKPIKKEDLLLKKNKEYLKTIHDTHNKNDNPIINAEDYDDYMEKMRIYNEKKTQILKREDIINEVKNLKEEKTPNENEEDLDFGIEPEHKVDNIKIEGSIKKDASSIAIDPSGITNVETEDNSEEANDDEEENEGEKSPINPSNFYTTSEKDMNTRSMKFMEKKDENNTKDDLNKKFDINTSRNFNFDILGGNNLSKQEEPNFSYNSNYVRPPIELLKSYEVDTENIEMDTDENIRALEEVLEEFKIPAKVEDVRRGARFTRYELHMPTGITVKKIQAHDSDIALALAAKGDIRIEAPIKGKSAVGIEVPNDKVDIIGLREMISSPEFTEAKAPLTFALGKDVEGSIYCCNLAKTPHLLVAGSTGSGKSVCLNSLILSLIYRISPEDLRLILIDPKLVEFSVYTGLPHMLLKKAVNDPKKALKAFDWLVNEMERRYRIFQECFVKNLTEYNAQPDVLSHNKPKLPFIILIVDELADLIITTNKKELEEKIIKLAQKARAAGIHLILATQRPSVDIITGSIKINLPTRIAFAVTNFMDSKTILDQGGAERLLGKGDMLYSFRNSEPCRIQGAFVDTPEVKAVVDFIKEHNESVYDENIDYAINGEDDTRENGFYVSGSTPSIDSLMPDALKVVVENGKASISMLERHFAIGYQRAAKIIDQMEMAGFISSSDGSKPRVVYVTMSDYNKIYGNNDNVAD